MENGLLFAAVFLSAGAAVLSFLPQSRNRKLVKIIWCLTAGCVITDLLLMAGYLVGNRFEYFYVFNHTDMSLPVIYRISALWSGQEGSFLLWAATSAVAGFFVLKKRRAFGVYSVICVFILLMCLISQPFSKQSVIPADGLGMTETLKDPWMVVHPPLVFTAYSSMGVLASWTADFSKTGIEKRMHTWTVVSWVTLGAGIFTGSIWAYRALGWGGYWAWDPIESAALIPWLILCGNLHSKEKMNRLKCVAPFLSACLGTFLVRSGILRDFSTHAYTEGNTVISVLIVVLLLTGFTILLVLKLKTVSSKISLKKTTVGIKKTLFPLVIYIYSFLIALGTLAPLVLSVPTPITYYTTISIIFILIYCASLARLDMDTLKRRYILMFAVSTVFTVAIIAATECFNILMILLLWVCFMPLSLWIAAGFKTQSMKYYIVHTGFLLLILGSIISLGFSKEMYKVVDISQSYIDIGGGRFLLEDILSKDQITVHLFVGDIIVRGSENVMLSNNTIMIPLQTRPVILSFWIGGWMTILGPIIACIISKVDKRNGSKRLGWG